MYAIQQIQAEKDLFQLIVGYLVNIFIYIRSYTLEAIIIHHNQCKFLLLTFIFFDNLKMCVTVFCRSVCPSIFGREVMTEKILQCVNIADKMHNSSTYVGQLLVLKLYIDYINLAFSVLFLL